MMQNSLSAIAREQPAQAALTRNEVHDHFKRVLAGTKWEPIRGLHSQRHSFISACAQQGNRSAAGAGMGRAHERGHVETLPAPLSLDAAGGDQGSFQLKDGESFTAQKNPLDGKMWPPFGGQI